MLEKMKGDSGFTIIEMLFVMAMIGILAQMAMNFMGDLKYRSSDISAVTDGRNLITVVRGNFINLEDVNYTHNPGAGPLIGTTDTSGNPRTPVFTLTPGVMARIEPGSVSGIAEQGFYEAYLFHESGTPDSTPSGKREFWYLADELNAIYSLPTY